MKPNTIDLSAYNYAHGHTYYDIDLAEYNNSASVYLEIHSTKDVSVELVHSGSGEIFTLQTGEHIKIKTAILDCIGIKLRTKKSAHVAYICKASQFGGAEKLDSTPLSISPAKNEFFLEDMIRRELTKRLHHMGMAQDDVNDLLDEDDFEFDDEDEAELPDDTQYTEMEEELLPEDHETETPPAEPSTEPTAENPEPTLSLPTEPPKPD